jgi:hypothetical protein
MDQVEEGILAQVEEGGMEDQEDHQPQLELQRDQQGLRDQRV